jgi:hypothetical protein
MLTVIAEFEDLRRLTESVGRLHATGVTMLNTQQATAEGRLTVATMVERIHDTSFDASPDETQAHESITPVTPQTLPTPPVSLLASTRYYTRPAL